MQAYELIRMCIELPDYVLIFVKIIPREDYTFQYNPVILTGKERLISELTRSYSWALETNWNSLCVYNVGRQARSADCIDTVLSVFKFIINIGCL